MDVPVAMSTAHRDGGLGAARAARSGRHVAPPALGPVTLVPAGPRMVEQRGRRAARVPDVLDADDVLDVADAPVTDRPDAVRATRTAGVVRALLHSAVALQAEDLLRTIGALAVAAQRGEGTIAAVDWVGWVERDVRDLGHLARAALQAGASLPAGLDVGRGDPSRPESIVEGLLAGHEAVLGVLRQLAAVGGDEPWHAVASRIAARRQAEAVALRVTVGDSAPAVPERLHVGRAPDRHFGPDLIV